MSITFINTWYNLKEINDIMKNKKNILCGIELARNDKIFVILDLEYNQL